MRYEEVIARIKNGEDKSQFERICISMISHPHSNADTFVLLERWTKEMPRVPVSIRSNPTTLDYDDLVRMRDLGADIFTVALDAVTPAIFDRTRGKGVDSPHKWDKYWRTLEWARKSTTHRNSAPTSSAAWEKPNRKCCRSLNRSAIGGGGGDITICSLFFQNAVR